MGPGYLPVIEQWSQSSGSSVILRRARPGRLNDLLNKLMSHRSSYTGLCPECGGVEKIDGSARGGGGWQVFPRDRD